MLDFSINFMSELIRISPMMFEISNIEWNLYKCKFCKISNYLKLLRKSRDRKYFGESFGKIVWTDTIKLCEILIWNSKKSKQIPQD